jgi:hypothetical protein
MRNFGLEQARKGSSTFSEKAQNCNHCGTTFLSLMFRIEIWEDFFVFNFVGGFLSSSLCPSSHSLLLTNASPLPFVRSFASTFLCFTLSMGVYRIRCTPIYSTFSTLS